MADNTNEGLKEYLHEDIREVRHRVDVLEESTNARFEAMNDTLHSKFEELQSFMGKWLLKITAGGFVLFGGLLAWEWSILDKAADHRSQMQEVIQGVVVTQKEMSTQLGMITQYLQKDLENQDEVHRLMLQKLEEALDDHETNGH